MAKKGDLLVIERIAEITSNFQSKSTELLKLMET